MAEEWGGIVIGAAPELLDELVQSANSDAGSAVRHLAESARIAAANVATADTRIGAITRHGGYACFDFDSADWFRLAPLFVRKAKGIEFYARTQNEHGTAEVHALSADGARFSFSFDADGDAWDLDDADWDEDGDEDKIRAELENWWSRLPAEVKESFPEFADIDDFVFDGP